MPGDQEFSKAMTLRATETGLQTGLPWGPATLICTLLFLAEHSWPAQVLNGTENDYVAKLKGSGLREFCYVTIFLIGIFYLIRATGYRFAWRSPVAVAFGSLLAWCSLSIMWSEEPGTSIKRVIAYLFMTTGAAGIAAFWSRKQILQLICLSGAAQLTVGVAAEIVTGYFTPWVSDYRFAGTQPWNVEGFCCLLLVLSSLAAGDTDPRHKILFRILALYGLAFLVLTKSRSSMMGVTAGYLVYLFLTRPLVTKVWFSIAVSTSALLLYMSGLSTSLIDYLTRGGEGVDNFTGRQPMWELALTFVKKRPMIGYGYEGFWTVRNVDYFTSELHWSISSAHSSYLENLLALGCIGLVLHVSVLIFGIVRGSLLFRNAHSPIFALAAAICAVFLAVGTLESVVLWSPGPYSFGVALLVWSLCLEKTETDAYMRSDWKIMPRVE
jgi:O-antigen ligase